MLKSVMFCNQGLRATHIAALSQRSFARWTPPSQAAGLTEEFIAREKELFQKNVDKRQKVLLNARRLAMAELDTDPKYNERLWWNKLRTMSYEEAEELPFGFTMKYGTFLNKIFENQRITAVEESRAFEGRYGKLRELERLLTNEEIAAA